MQCHTTSMGCWEINSHKPEHDGYIRISRNGKRYRAHRYIYEQYKGPIPIGYFVCHSCDNPLCINPKHLWVGTNSQNIIDAYKKGRFHKRTKGTKLTLEQATNLKKELKNTTGIGSLTRLALKYNIHISTACEIRKGKNWKHAI